MILYYVCACGYNQKDEVTIQEGYIDTLILAVPQFLRVLMGDTAGVSGLPHCSKGVYEVVIDLS